ncbi:exotoxin beta-grasp domain-containing protein, partial [Escherichia coli]|uniref:exotoxin beta-grasp domain-containing protein n=1 Tax=Escherichia coli TaxID=562 RepID=UPI0039C876E1
MVKTLYSILHRSLDLTNKDPQSSIYYIPKEDISLKELDFKLRKQLISQSGLYS